ncbi:PREDICTED: uncharacterized protein LOC108534020 [Rhinopithecus bieti]|uniref:uncharacterized protein LOC108534020 n=1 Tax=Rhinopithecus bieti TaxID=61621 RepID=UPI00083C53B2|nr:PREDICTED: uncharacterized protein LOC108534020 [Rhinopithecus bieti]
MAGDNDRDPVKIQAIPRAVALTRANLEGLTWAETVRTRYHHCSQLSQNQTLPAVKMAAATAAVVAPTLAVTRQKKLLLSVSMRRIAEPMMRKRKVGLRGTGLSLGHLME